MSGFKNDPVDGIVGLAFKSIAVEGVTPPLIAAIEQNILQTPLFTVWLDRRVRFSYYLFDSFISFKFVSDSVFPQYINNLISILVMNSITVGLTEVTEILID